MNRRKACSVLAAGLVAASLLGAAPAFAETVVKVAYPFPETWKPVHAKLAEAFQAAHPDIRIEFLAPYADYEEATQKILRGAMTGDVPDLAWMGLNRQRIFVDKDAAIDLTPFIAKEADWDARGYTGAMMDLGKINGKVYGIASGISSAIIYYNADLVREVGGDPDNFPSQWDDVIAIGGKIKATGKADGMFIEWDGTGNWLFQNLVFSAGGTMLTEDEKDVAFGGTAGVAAVSVLAKMVKDGGMPNIDGDTAVQAFLAGKLGMYISSVSDVQDFQANIGDRFVMKTTTFPLIVPEGKIAAGGAAGMMFAKDPAVQAAAWEYLKFAGSAEGGAITVQNSGYMPPNPLAVEKYLVDFYKEHPNQFVSTKQLPILTGWYAFPGENGLKISDVIKDYLGKIVSGEMAPEAGVTAMAAEVKALLPN